ncbi:MAG: lysophospholipid acyltransferase family protein [Coriobacteriia bacterium]|nr:lysophospholipid acyltransferase family protein [Coriobacteriia bacterium]
MSEVIGRAGMRMAVAAARVMPQGPARRTAAAMAAHAARSRTSALARAARVNQYVVSGRTLPREALDVAVRENVRLMALFLYDFYKVLGDEKAEDALVVRDDAFHAFVERERSAGPFVYVGVHMGNFDLVGRALGRAGWRMQVLSVPDPGGSYQWQNEVREQAGFEVTPVSVGALKEAARRLEHGGSVLTGVDRPMPEPDKVEPRFFGLPAPLPLLHVRLAMRAGVPVIPFGGRLTDDGRYRIACADPVPMLPGRPTTELLVANAEAVLAPVERLIAEAPAQWSMPHVVWPGVDPPG